jgi:PleD family two-component response regulator
VTVSIGCARRLQGESLQSLMGRADAALYVAKRNGRNQVVMAPTDVDSLPELV